MYIIYETIGNNDPRFDPKLEYVSTAWHYTISKVPADHVSKVNLELLKATEITEGMAHAHHFTNAVDGEISVMKNVLNPADIIQPTSEGDADYAKVDYKLSSTDEVNAIGLLKAMMLNFAENHFTEELGLVQIRTKVPSLTTLKNTQMFFATYFEWDCAYTAGKEKTPEFQTPKYTQEIFE